MTTKPKLLDLFCGAGGAAVGYHNAGFEVIGVDSERQKNYPFEFYQADAMTFSLEGFDVIHASPPCQAYSITKHTHKKQHPDLLGPTRDRLISNNKPYVIENVPGALMPNAITLCGASFFLVSVDFDNQPLVLKRHRKFESNLFLETKPCMCKWFKDRGYRVGGVYGGGSTDRHHAQHVRHGGYTPAKEVRQELMGIDWMSLANMNQAIPPIYTQFVGEQIIQQLEL